MRHLLLVVCIFISAIVCAQPAITPQELKTFQDSAKAHSFNGSFLIVQGKEPLLQLNMGKTNENNGMPITSETRFNLGSIGKSFTAILAMQAVAEGHFRLDDTVARYLPKQPVLPNANKITIRQLLSHTSGLGDFFEHPQYNENTILTTDDFYGLVCTMKPALDTPGLRMIYSNAGFIVLGKILEGIWKQPYQQLVQERIFAKAGLQKNANGPIATGYTKVGEKWEVGEGNDPQKWSAAGGVFLSVQQLHQLIKALAGGQLLSAASLEQLWASQVQPAHEPPFVKYALGWMREEPAGMLFLGHNGGSKGHQAAFRYLPKNDLYIYVLSNRDGGAEALMMQVLMQLINKNGGLNEASS